MKLLNCRVGDLAVTVKAELPENIGNVVRIIGSEGERSWYGFDKPTHVWEVVIVEGGPLVYESGNGQKSYTHRGCVPDVFLRRIARPRPETIEELEEDCCVL
ncbi:MAG: hypothetical protein EBT15_08475 [Betaproteobacteria bacterium]|nr:hypothetical protein [Betaproteobacteria bacterium]